MFYPEILDKYYNEIERSYGDYQHILNNFINRSGVPVTQIRGYKFRYKNTK